MTKSLSDLCDIHIESLIPWYVTNQLCEDELVKVQHHIDDCADCAKIVEEERKIAIFIQEREANKIPSDWKIFQQQLLNFDLEHPNPMTVQSDSEIKKSPHNIIRFPILRKTKIFISKPKTLGFIITAQAAALFAIILTPDTNVFNNIANEDDQIYNTLSSDQTEPNQNINIVMQFDPSLTIEELNTLLNNNKIKIISGPTSTNAYRVKVPNDITLETLRSHENILIAEPISAE